jgi:anthraniloyl-CoA monooxygenase
VLETDPETFRKAGLESKSEEESRVFLEGVFKDELAGHPLITNRSIWRQFPMIRNERWTKDGRLVLLGDAKATAHFSIGSGTKLAMEDAIGLYESFRRMGGQNVKAALADYETTRREEVEKTQHSANVSLVWFEHVKRFWNMSPNRFIFGLMTRSKAITYDNLALRAPEFVDEVDHMVADETKAQGFDVDTKTPVPPMFQPFQLREMVVPNRVVVSPMCQYSAKDGLPNDWHLVHLGSRAIGGAGLVFTEMTDVSAEARISPGCTGLYNDEQEQAWKRIVDFVHANSGAKICMQLGHAGRKGATKLSWEGNDEPLEKAHGRSCRPLPFPISRTARCRAK